MTTSATSCSRGAVARARRAEVACARLVIAITRTPARPREARRARTRPRCRPSSRRRSGRRRRAIGWSSSSAAASAGQALQRRARAGRSHGASAPRTGSGCTRPGRRRGRTAPPRACASARSRRRGRRPRARARRRRARRRPGCSATRPSSRRATRSPRLCEVAAAGRGHRVGHAVTPERGAATTVTSGAYGPGSSPRPSSIAPSSGDAVRDPGGERRVRAAESRLERVVAGPSGSSSRRPPRATGTATGRADLFRRRPGCTRDRRGGELVGRVVDDRAARPRRRRRPPRARRARSAAIASTGRGRRRGGAPGDPPGRRSGAARPPPGAVRVRGPRARAARPRGPARPIQNPPPSSPSRYPWPPRIRGSPPVRQREAGHAGSGDEAHAPADREGARVAVTASSATHTSLAPVAAATRRPRAAPRAVRSDGAVVSPSTDAVDRAERRLAPGACHAVRQLAPPCRPRAGRRRRPRPSADRPEHRAAGSRTARRRTAEHARSAGPPIGPPRTQNAAPEMSALSW